jgi:hypothetical protein
VEHVALQHAPKLRRIEHAVLVEISIFEDQHTRVVELVGLLLLLLRVRCG